MSVSILRDGKLWGLFACHHYSPRHISFEKRTASELFGQMFSWILEGRERESDVDYETRAHKIQERLMETRGNARPQQARDHRFHRRLPQDDRLRRHRGVVGRRDHARRRDADRNRGARSSIGFINRTSPGRICASAEIAKVYAAGESFRDRAAGFLAIPISRVPRDCLIFFRREVLRSVNWAGDPNKILSGRAARRAADAAQEF